MHGIRTDIFKPQDSPLMSRDALEALTADDTIGRSKKLMTLAHQARAALADGDIERVAFIEQLKAVAH